MSKQALNHFSDLRALERDLPESAELLLEVNKGIDDIEAEIKQLKDLLNRQATNMGRSKKKNVVRGVAAKRPKSRPQASCRSDQIPQAKFKIGDKIVDDGATDLEIVQMMLEYYRSVPEIVSHKTELVAHFGLSRYDSLINRCMTLDEIIRSKKQASIGKKKESLADKPLKSSGTSSQEEEHPGDLMKTYIKPPSAWFREVDGLSYHLCGKAFTCSCCGRSVAANQGYRVDNHDIFFCRACKKEIYTPSGRGWSGRIIFTPMGNKR